MECPNFPKMSLETETRWSRSYRSADGHFSSFRSRFLDGTATVTLAELKTEWPRWKDHERLDFCCAFACGADVPERDDILRFLIGHSQTNDCVRMTIALNVAMYLPAKEAVPVLEDWCLMSDVGQCANFFQALAITKDRNALTFLRNCFQRVWNSEGMMATADFQNWTAYDAVCCMKHMLELGEDTVPLRSAYETLKLHPCAGTRGATQRWLSEYFEIPS
jgi:hypothetical protein